MTTTFISQQHGFAHSVRPACDHQRTVIPGPRLDALRALTGGSLLDLTGPFARLPSCYRGCKDHQPECENSQQECRFSRHRCRLPLKSTGKNDKPGCGGLCTPHHRFFSNGTVDHGVQASRARARKQ